MISGLNNKYNELLENNIEEIENPFFPLKIRKKKL
jgi:hypothetical protein